MSQQKNGGTGGNSGGSSAGQQKPRTSTGAGTLPAQASGMSESAANLRVDSSILTSHQKNLLGSNFADSSAERKRNTLLAASLPNLTAASKREEPVSDAKVPVFDGKSVPEALQNRDLWKAVAAPATSRAGKRSKATYESVLNQFGVSMNPRYDDDAPGKQRGHIFVWDVSRAMECEIPHFVGAKELSLAQTCDWLRHEGPMRGWKRVSDTDIIDAANAGHLVIALPRELRTKYLAVVRPQDYPTDGSPRLTGVAMRRADGGVHPRDMFGAKPVDCYFHD